MVGMRTREGLSSLGSSDGVPEAPTDVWACRRLSPLLGLGTAHPWLWPGRALKWGVICEIEPGVWPPQAVLTAPEPCCLTNSLSGPRFPIALRSEAHATETPRQGGGQSWRAGEALC